MRFIVTSLLVILGSACFGQHITEPDTLYSLISLSGNIAFDQPGWVSYVYNDTLHKTGDEYNPNYETFLAEYTYLSVSTPILPDGQIINNAELHFKILACVGNSIFHTYPIFDYADSTSHPPLMLDHIDYGSELDQSDVQIPPNQLTPPIFVLDSLFTGWVSVDITDWLRDDITTSRPYSQYRLRLEGDSDWDEASDFIAIYGEFIDEYCPYLSYQCSVSVSVDEEVLPCPGYALHAYPNPFNPETTVRFNLAEPGHSTLCVYNVRGRHVATLLDESLPAGSHSVTWTADGCASGIYFARLNTPAGVSTTVLCLLK
ncbi:MAG: T9SS type A sorting domain-containing protein [Candidatus Cloacimonetes bacterium]|nr:T9SS type A sorting domain-containing protein [Candidatus Cloacimonadota bacterium]